MSSTNTESQTQDQHWMSVALELAAKAEALGEVPVGAVVVLDDVVIGEGWNQPISGCDPTAHAEIMALRSAAKQQSNYRLPEATLYVTLEPCTMCAGAIIHSRVKRVVFAAPEPKAGAVISNGSVFDREEMNHRVEYTGGVGENQAVQLIQAFFKRRREEAKAARKARKAGGSSSAG
ncbi:tRNA adenosine(34) deaminase TadA [Pseudomaricurvus sp.]|uniref:tRNA adenosine(34) deaminase TadA n=1 Tax=Pseudomaricurvus sp. TaxID=2004510 RepID=UPI003F6AEB1E